MMQRRLFSFDFERRLWRIHTTKLGKPRFVPMSDGVINLLETVPSHFCDWVFPNLKTLKPYVSIYYSWDSARREAGLENVRIHDLRHSYASFLVNAGRTPVVTGQLRSQRTVKMERRLPFGSLPCSSKTVFGCLWVPSSRFRGVGVRWGSGFGHSSTAPHRCRRQRTADEVDSASHVLLVCLMVCIKTKRAERLVNAWRLADRAAIVGSC